MSKTSPMLLMTLCATLISCGARTEVASLGGGSIQEQGDSGVSEVVQVDVGLANIDSGISSMDASVADAFVPDGPDARCIETCDERKENDETCFSDDYDGCIEFCNDIASWQTSTQDAFYFCVNEDPLCFQTITQCVITTAFPDPVPIIAKFVGTRFEQFEGKRVYAMFDPGRTNARTEAVVMNGQHELIWEIDSNVGSLTKTIFYYVDVDDDGRCNPRTDRTQYGSVEYTGTIETHSFYGTRELQDSPNSAAMVCRGFN